MSTMEEPELVKAEELGPKPEWMLILRIHGPSGGADTQVKKMLFSMNFEEELISRTCSDGSIGTRFEWRKRELQPSLKPSLSGLPVIYHQMSGTGS